MLDAVESKQGMLPEVPGPVKSTSAQASQTNKTCTFIHIQTFSQASAMRCGSGQRLQVFVC